MSTKIELEKEILVINRLISEGRKDDAKIAFEKLRIDFKEFGKEFGVIESSLK